MNCTLEVKIDGVPISQREIEEWEVRRIQTVLPKLRRVLKLQEPAHPPLNDLPLLRAQLLGLKEQCGRQRLRAILEKEIRISRLFTKFIAALSGSRRKQCVTEVRVMGGSAKQIALAIDDLMSCDTERNRLSNLLACPDHYVLEPRGQMLEVIETTGGSPFPAQFFMHFGDESGVRSLRDPSYAYQSVGTARLADGTVIGGVRHQFRDDENGAVARLMVEFPALTPGYMLREHQWHLACEFSHWLGGAPRACCQSDRLGLVTQG